MKTGFLIGFPDNNSLCSVPLTGQAYKKNSMRAVTMILCFENEYDSEGAFNNHMKIAQITDIHLNDFMFNSEGLNVMDNLKIILEDIKSRNIKKVVLTGDYGDSNEFNRILKEIELNNLEYEYILGNHDDFEQYKYNKELINRVKKTGLFFNIKRNGILFMFLDTRLGRLDKFQLDYIDIMCKHNIEENIILFTHHPILNCGDTFMDSKFSLTNRSEVLDLLLRLDKRIVIFSGHYHSNLFIEKNNVRQFVTMSALLQIKKYSNEIEVDSYDFGYRIIDLNNNIESEIVEFRKVN